MLGVGFAFLEGGPKLSEKFKASRALNRVRRFLYRKLWKLIGVKWCILRQQFKPFLNQKRLANFGPDSMVRPHAVRCLLADWAKTPEFCVYDSHRRKYVATLHKILEASTVTWSGLGKTREDAKRGDIREEMWGCSPGIFRPISAYGSRMSVAVLICTRLI